MSLVAAAICPHPPLIVPAVAGGAAAELDDLRAACDAAVAQMLDADPGLVVVVGDALRTGAFSAGDSGSFAPYGVALTVPLGPRLCAGQSVLPLSLTVGAWLLARAGWTGDRQGYGVSAETPAAVRAGYGAELAGLDERVALLVMGDGSARRGDQGPGSFDSRAQPFDAAVAAALGSGDADALAALDPAHAIELMVAGRASWQLLAGAATGKPTWQLLAAPVPRSWRAELRYAAAPYGVGYVVASWRLVEPTSAVPAR